MNLKFGYKISHEQYDPNKLLEHAILAEKYGFESLWASDHFHPWAHTNAASGFAWVWLASAAERTRNIRMGTSVTAPILRYHPAIVAQAFATLAVMYPGRIFLGLGAGEALNESPLGFIWPSPKERIERLEEAIIVIKKLWKENFVTFEGKYFKLRRANLYTRPDKPIKIYVAAGGPKTAELAGKYSDGLIAFIEYGNQNQTEKLFQALKKGAKKANKEHSSLERVAEVLVSYDEDYEKALKSCRFWAGSMLPVFYKFDISDPREIEEHGKFVGDKEMTKYWIVSTTDEEHIKKIEWYIKTGFNHLHFTSSSPDEKKFLKFYAENVLPYLKDTYSK